jgi:GNAT superfamily N-acetyltransferase
VTIHVTPLARDDLAALEAFSDIEAAARRQDVPDFPVSSTRAAVIRLSHDWPGQTTHLFLATDTEQPDRPVGALGVDLPYLDNTQLAELNISVHPAHRRRGLGRALYQTAVAFAREHGRRVVQSEAVTALPGGPHRDPGHGAFAEAMGAKVGLEEVRRRLDLDTVDRSGWERASTAAGTHAVGYSFVRWTGTTPDDLVADVAALDSRLVLDAPMGDLMIEVERIDVARTRQIEEAIRIRGRRPYHCGMRHDASGALAAWTNLTYDPDQTEHAWQQITIVDPAHRGHRLGLLVKIENLRHALAQEPGTRWIDTWNAAENTHMIGINESMGFRAVDGWQIWQAEI